MAFEPIDHTADVGYELVADTLAELYAEAARALTDTIVDLGSVRGARVFHLEATGIDRETLLVAWLGELLYRFDADRVLFCRHEITISQAESEWRLTARSMGEGFDAQRHQEKVHVKAATYHGLRVEPVGERWAGRVIFDI